jgi:hypothetical protein
VQAVAIRPTARQCQPLGRAGAALTAAW